MNAPGPGLDLSGVTTLQLVVTYGCNLACAYCPTHKADDHMTPATASLALERFLGKDGLPHLDTVRFFGAEPLMNLEVITTAAAKARELRFKQGQPPPTLAVTTNGTLLTAPVLKALEGFQLTVSLDGPPEVQHATRPGAADSIAWLDQAAPLLIHRQPPVTVNLTIAPSQARHLMENFRWLYGRGFRSFNLLPAYYTPWSKARLADLARSFATLARLVTAMEDKGLRLAIRNRGVQSPTPFFNQALTVDTDGELYLTNAILTRRLRPFRASLGIGNAAQIHLHPPAVGLEDLLCRAFTRPQREGTAAADRLLGDFVAAIGPGVRP